MAKSDITVSQWEEYRKTLEQETTIRVQMGLPFSYENMTLVEAYLYLHWKKREKLIEIIMGSEDREIILVIIINKIVDFYSINNNLEGFFDDKRFLLLYEQNMEARTRERINQQVSFIEKFIEHTAKVKKKR